jgi:hypothetical protein
MLSHRIFQICPHWLHIHFSKPSIQILISVCSHPGRLRHRVPRQRPDVYTGKSKNRANGRAEALPRPFPAQLAATVAQHYDELRDTYEQADDGDSDHGQVLPSSGVT